MHKRCCGCKIEKPLKDYDKNRCMKDGLQDYCKACRSEKARITRVANHDIRLAQEAAYRAAHREADRAYHREYARNYYATHPEVVKARKERFWAKNRDRVLQLNRTKYAARKAARGILWRALQAGVITKAVACQGCGVTDTNLSAHHSDYTQPLVVEWLCTLCHGTRHRCKPVES